MGEIEAKVWTEVKRRERGYSGPDSSLLVALRPPRGGDGDNLERRLDRLGAEIKRKWPRGKTLVSRLQARYLPEVAAWPAVGDLRLVTERRRGVVPWGLAGLAVAGLLALTGWWAMVSPEPGGPAGRHSTATQAPRNLYQAGLAAYRGGNKDETLRLWRRLVKRHPQRLGVRRGLAWLLLELGRLREAEEQLRAILALRPGDPEALDALARIQGEIDTRRGANPVSNKRAESNKKERIP